MVERYSERVPLACWSGSDAEVTFFIKVRRGCGADMEVMCYVEVSFPSCVYVGPADTCMQRPNTVKPFSPTFNAWG